MHRASEALQVEPQTVPSDNCPTVYAEYNVG